MQESTGFLNSPMQAALSGPPDIPCAPRLLMQSGLQMSPGATLHPGFQHYPSPLGVPCLPWLPRLSMILIALQHSGGSGRNTTCQQGAASAQQTTRKAWVPNPWFLLPLAVRISQTNQQVQGWSKDLHSSRQHLCSQKMRYCEWNCTGVALQRPTPALTSKGAWDLFSIQAWMAMTGNMNLVQLKYHVPWQ